MKRFPATIDPGVLNPSLRGWQEREASFLPAQGPRVTLMSISSRHFFVCLVSFGLVALVGCGSPTGNVSGTVKYKGTALDHGTVSFVAQPAGTVHSGEIKPDGTYEVKGIPYGPAIITVMQLPNDALSPTELRKKQILEGKKPNEFIIPDNKSILPEKYLKADEDNPLVFEIKANQASFDLELED
jgi:hypothetical protein